MSRTEYQKKFLLTETIDGISHEYATKQALVTHCSIRALQRYITQNGTNILQGYLTTESGARVAQELNINVDFEPREVQLRQRGTTRPSYHFTIKGKLKPVVEREISPTKFYHYWDLTVGRQLEKIHYTQSIIAEQERFDVQYDLFTDRPTIMLAKITTANASKFAKIPVLGLDVTDNPLYKNKQMVK